MREERFKHALPVLGVMRFLRGGLHGVFCPWREHAGGGAFGRGPVRATPATPVGGQLRREGVARRGKKPLGRSPGASFLSPLSWAIQRTGARGGRGRARYVWAFGSIGSPFHSKKRYISGVKLGVFSDG